jgi:hypothetical protein
MLPAHLPREATQTLVHQAQRRSSALVGPKSELIRLTSALDSARSSWYRTPLIQNIPP